ncbi:ComEC/Rec2 family competence protein [Runella slithyformis]|uniref:Metallo-beta-lactamase superfamily hydrolase n=1 Tax=Runella slithyformis (strain ATCC 29530 / DSM 19594 / LMG 11500 / NCIMB 11436 / LSU 4) TaxID=761193 RepID=A0A7U4E8Z7_RUNSL|nr:MBL fold metallo-hydrolase [Runella slithyformis]AEI52158.1 metallo-beta-lactamase superfamily hydrolase [Runella slithyformis DSM 19594]
MPRIHFLNVLEGDCNIIQHDSGRVTVMDVSNAYDSYDTPEEKAVKASQQRKEMLNRTNVPSGKTDYRQKQIPDNPIEYLKNNLNVSNIFRFIVTHPDMDHLDGIKDLYSAFSIQNMWDTDNDKYIDTNNYFAGYNKEDWKFYTQLRTGKIPNTQRCTFYAGDSNSFYAEDSIKILSPTPALVVNANRTKDYNDASYVLLFTSPKKGGGVWKFLFAGDSHDDSWNYILNNYRQDVSNVDVLFAPHHGRDSSRDYSFLKVLKPRLTLFGNADSKHLAYNCYPGPPTGIRITNNQAGYVILDVNESRLIVYVKHYDFARDFRSKRKWETPVYDKGFKAYPLFQFNA